MSAPTYLACGAAVRRCPRCGAPMRVEAHHHSWRGAREVCTQSGQCPPCAVGLAREVGIVMSPSRLCPPPPGVATAPTEMPPVDSDTPEATRLRATIRQEYGVARSHFAYAGWLLDLGCAGRARQVYRDGSRACARGMESELALEQLTLGCQP